MNGHGNMGAVWKFAELFRHPARAAAIRTIPQFVGQPRPQASDEQQFAGRWQIPDLIGGEQRPARMMLRVTEAGPVAVHRLAGGLEHHRSLSQEIGSKAGAVVIVDAEDLQDADIGEEGCGARAIGGA